MDSQNRINSKKTQARLENRNLYTKKQIVSIVNTDIID